MPTQRKIESVEMLSQLLSKCTIAISTDFTGMDVRAMTAFRKVLRDSDTQYKVIKNNLVYLAADEAGKPLVKDIVEGATGIAFGFDEPTVPAKAIADFIRANRVSLSIRGAVLDDRILEAAEVDSLSQLPSKDVLVARLLGQMQGIVTSLVYVLNAPVAGFTRALQAVADVKEDQDGETGQEEPPVVVEGQPEESDADVSITTEKDESGDSNLADN